jgi:hypothetical protein
MSNVVGEIAINVTADVGPLMREIGRGTTAMAGMQRMSASVSGGLKRFGAATTDLGKKLSIVSAGIAAITAASFALVKSAASAGDAIGDAAKAAGMSTTAFQEYRFALKEAAAMTDEDFASAATRLNKSLGEARAGSESAVKAFEAIGVSQEQLAKATFTTDEAFAAFVAKMEATRDPALAAAIATDLFGKAGAGLGAGLSGVPGQVGSLVERARELGVVMGPAAVEAAGKFDQKMNELGTQFEAVKMKIAEVLLPVIVDKLIPVLQETVIPAIEAVVTKIGEWITWFGELDPAIQTFVGAITTAFAVGGPVLLAIGTISSAIGALVAATGPVGLLVAAAGLIITAWTAWGDDIKAAIEPAVQWISEKFTWLMEVMDSFLGKIKSMAQAVTDFFSVSQQEIDAMDFSGAEGLGFGTGSGGGLGVDPGGGNGGGAGGGMGGQMMGAAIVNGMVIGATQAMEERRQQLMDLFNQVPQMARDVLGIQSPSTVFAEIGNFLGQGMAQGIGESQALVGQAVSAMGQTAVTATDGTVSSILSSLGTLFQGSKKFGIAQALINAWIGASEALKLPFPQNLAAFAKVLATGMSAVKNIKSAQPGKSGGGGGGTASGAGGGVVQQAPATTMNFTVQNDPFGYGERFARSLAEQMNAARRNGSQIIATVTSS